MTRRIAIAILLTVWMTLLIAGVGAYFLIRTEMLNELDATLVERASALPELLPADGRTSPEKRSVIGQDQVNKVDDGRYVIRAENSRRTLAKSMGDPAVAARPVLLSSSFSTLADGRAVRSVTLRATARPAAPGEPPLPVLVTYSGPADSFHRVLKRIALGMAGCGAFAGLLAGLAAWGISVQTLRPLSVMARLLGSVNERRLDRRVPLDELPRELLLVGRRLNRMLVKLEQSFARRRRFLADASHELRTPVAALVTGIEVALSRERERDAYRTALEAAGADAAELQRLVEGLMELVRSERRSTTAAWEDLNAAQLLDQCVAMARRLALPRGVSVIPLYAPDLPIRTQPERFRSIITNLLANGVEYNNVNGSVEVIAACADDHLRVIIKDTGPGIAKSQLDSVFEPFFRGDVARSAGGGHLGLGLHIVQSHVHALGGTCQVASRPGEGTEIKLTFPLNSPDGEVLEPSGVVEGTSTGSIAKRNGSHAVLTNPS